MAATKATMHVAGTKVSFPIEQTLQFQQRLKAIEPGGYAEFAVTEDDGFPIWVFVPYGTAVVIVGWDD